MAHSSEARWGSASQRVASAAANAIQLLKDAEEAYQELLEVYNYTGGSDQDFADQLFKEVWESRSVPGVQAVLTVDVSGGVVSNPVVSNAGTGYPDGTGFQLALTVTAAGGGADAVLEYDVVSGSITNLSVVNGGSGYSDGNGQTVQETPAPGQIFDTQANADEVAQAQDLRLAIVALHELHQAADNQAVAQDDRYAALRRMS